MQSKPRCMRVGEIKRKGKNVKESNKIEMSGKEEEIIEGNK